MRRAFLAALFMSTALGGASAADLYGAPAVAVPPTVVPAYVYNWTGLYLGLHAGYGFGNSDWNVPTSFDVDGFVGGVQLGWLYQFPTSGFVAGAELQWTWTGADGGGACPNPAFRCSTELGWMADARLKAGFAWDRALIYAVGGLALADVEHKARPTGGGFTQSDTEVGWTIGAGVAYAFTDALSLGVEYKYTAFPDISFQASGTRLKDDLDLHSVTARVNYKLGW